MRSMVWKWNNWLSGIAFSLSLCSRMAQCDRQCVTWRVINSRVEWGVNICAGKFDLPQWKLYRCWTEVPNRGGITVRNVLVSPRLILFRWKPGFDLVTRFQPLRFSFKPAAKYRAGLSVDSLLFGNFFFFFFLRKVDGYETGFMAWYVIPCFFQSSSSVSLYFFEIFTCWNFRI